jgi:hypothetical protein
MLNFKKITYMILNIVMICVLVFSLMIYTSLCKSLPWYDPCGTQFLAIIIISAPVLLIIGIILVFLDKKYTLQKINLILPFYALAGICLPILIDGSLSKITLSIGTILCISSIILTIVVFINHIRKNF